MKKTAILGLVCAVTSLPALAGHGSHWGYSGAEGPEHWGELDAQFSLCEKGKHQSPVDLSNAMQGHPHALSFNYKPGGSHELNNGHTIQVDYDSGSSITLDGDTYYLKQFHFHVPSENHIAGKEFPMEAHLVHADKDGHLAVVAVMFEAGAVHPALAAAWSQMPDHEDEDTNLKVKISAADLLPENRDYYRFTGSLTTPPCTEGVNWLVMKEPVQASKDQIAELAKTLGHPNNRPVQPLNARVIEN